MSLFESDFLLIAILGWMGERAGTLDESIRKRASDKKKKTRWAKSVDPAASTRKRRSRKAYDIKKGQEKRIFNKEASGTWEVGRYNNSPKHFVGFVASITFIYTCQSGDGGLSWKTKQRNVGAYKREAFRVYDGGISLLERRRRLCRRGFAALSQSNTGSGTSGLI